ncbi:MAG: trypsin-like peptidase domain-containing protein [Pseudomonadota bacterium]
MHRLSSYIALFALFLMGFSTAQANIGESIQSVVSILPVRAGAPVQAGQGRGQVPEASGIVVDGDGLIATAAHVLKAVRRIDVRLADGRILPAKLVGSDAASDIALIKVNALLKAFKAAPRPAIAQRVCAIGNSYGLDLSVTCGVVSALDVSHAGFNAIEDFVQTDAAANPGSSGGALVDSDGRLVGMMSAIFAAKSDTNIGVNFAVSEQLLRRVVDDLKDDGRVDYVKAGWRLSPLSRRARTNGHGANIIDVAAGGPAAVAGLKAGDILRSVGRRIVRNPKSALSALALVRVGGSVEIVYERSDQRRSAKLSFPSDAGARKSSGSDTAAAQSGADCPYPQAVCGVRQAVFPIESFDPIASAVRIADDLLVTNRHVVGARKTAQVFTPSGKLVAKVLPSTYAGDLALLQVKGLPKDGLVLKLSDNTAGAAGSKRLFVVGADVARKEVRVFKPGPLRSRPAQGAELGRLHVAAQMQPGVSGGALVNENGTLVGVAVGGGEGRNEAVPLAQVRALMEGLNATGAAQLQSQLGVSFEECAGAIDVAKRRRRGQRYDPQVIETLKSQCLVSRNPGQHLKASRFLAFARQYDASIALSKAAVEQVPNSINARVSYLVALQLAGRFEDMLSHARWVMSADPKDPRLLRFGIQAGIWGGDRALAEEAYSKLEAADPRQAQAARRFIDRPPPRPRRR